MAFKNMSGDITALTRDLVLLPLSIPTNGGTAPVAANVRGMGYVITRPGTGVYTLTPIAGLKMPNNPTVHVTRNFAFVANQGISVTVAVSTGVITLTHLNTTTGAAVEWPASGANSLVSVLVTFSNTSQLPNHS